VPDEPVGACKPRFQNTNTTITVVKCCCHSVVMLQTNTIMKCCYHSIVVLQTNTVMKCCCHSVVVLQTNTVMTYTNSGAGKGVPQARD
jgi:hypothetical protein